MNPTYQALTIHCQDHYVISARYFPAQHTDLPKQPILISPATGITQQFYLPFAEWLSSQGHPCMTFDFRGIGQSLHGHVKDSTASIQDWGQLDLPAAINHFSTLTGAERIAMIGHSAGGQLLGVVPNHLKVSKLVAIAGSTGHVKHLKGKTKLLAPVMFKLIFPIARITKGYGPTKFIGMGENLPKNVAQQWAEFCSKPGYIQNAIGRTIFNDFHQDVTTPIIVLWASDDEIATEANVKDLIRQYPNSLTSMIEVKPSDHGHRHIGHMLMFKKSHQNLWPMILQQLNA